MSPDRRGGAKGPEPEDRIDKIRQATYRSMGSRGRDGLTLLSSGISKGYLFPGTAEFENLPREKKIEAEEHRARVLFAVTNKVLDIAVLPGGRFDPVEFHGLYKYLTKNTSAPTNPGIDPDAQSATAEEIKKIREHVKKDKTRASFFSWDAVNNLYPDWLKRIWLRSGSGRIYQIVRDVTLPEYKASLAEEGIGQSHRAIAERRTREIPRDEHFGHPRITAYTGEKKEKPKPNQTYDIYRYQAFFKRMIVTHHEMEGKGYHQWKQNKEEATRNVLEQDYQEKQPTVTISTATVCVRKAQYNELGEEYGYDLNQFEPDAAFKRAMAFLSGSALHKIYQYAGNRLLEDQAKTEIKIPFLLEPTDNIKGKPDMLWRNPKTGEWQIAEFKNVGSYLFGKITREGLPDYMKSTKDIYAPLAEHRLQVLMYMWLLRKQGTDVKMGNIIYIHRDPRGNMKGIKEAIVVWDAIAELEVQNFVKELETANNQLVEVQTLKQNGTFSHELAEQILHDRTTEDPWVCGNCEAKLYCEPGKIFGHSEMAKEKKTELPPPIIAQAVREHEELEAKLIEDGVIGATLMPAGVLERTKKIKPDRTRSKYV